MSNRITLPAQLRPLSGDRDIIKLSQPVPAENVGDLAEQPAWTLRLLLDALEVECPTIKARLLDTNGNLNRFINLYVNEEDCKFIAERQQRKPVGDVPKPEELNPLDIKLNGYEDIAILPAIAGG